MSSCATQENGTASETSALLPQHDNRDSIITAVVEDEVPLGNASMLQTMVNMAKACMGQGCLVLPFAAKQGGLALHTFGLLAIALRDPTRVAIRDMCDHCRKCGTGRTFATLMRPRMRCALRARGARTNHGIRGE